MSEEETLEGNKLIAEFMGGYTLENQSKAPNIILPYLKKGYVIYHSKIEPIENQGDYSLEELKYYSSWDWIMPVVEKIERLDNADTVVTIQDDTCTIYGGDFNLVVDEYNKIDSVWRACVEFCKWYKIIKND